MTNKVYNRDNLIKSMRITERKNDPVAVKWVKYFFYTDRIVQKSVEAEDIYADMLQWTIFKLVYEHFHTINVRRANDFRNGINTSLGPIHDQLRDDVIKFVISNGIEDLQKMSEAELTLFKLVVLK